jgi:hypothetical protein
MAEEMIKERNMSLISREWTKVEKKLALLCK